MFPHRSLELKAAITLCVLFPYAATYVLHRLKPLWPLRFWQTALILVLFIVSFFVLSQVLSTLRQYKSDPFPLSFLIFYPLEGTAILFFGFPFFVFWSTFALLAWKSEPLRYLFLLFGLLAHLFYLLAVALYLFDIELIRL